MHRIFPRLLGSLLLCASLTPASAAAPVDPSVKFRLQPIATNLVSPLTVVAIPGSKELWIADQPGTVHRLLPDGSLSPDLVADFRSKMVQVKPAFDERGLLGLALHPKFAQNQKIYAYYSAPGRAGLPAEFTHTSHLSEFKVVNGRIDLASEKLLLQADQPYDNHNGGRIAFRQGANPDRDAHLYIAMGDGGNANDDGRRPEEGNGQNLNTLLGKILRIDVDSGTPYGIPKDNPYANGGGKPEIFAVGFRNPWGMTFDRVTGALYVADVGQNAFEEVNQVVLGGNYGWRVKEGTSFFNRQNPNQPLDQPPTGLPASVQYKDPILTYKNFKAFNRASEADGISITGGYVYRGKAIPALKGRYVFGDWSRNWGIPDGVLFAATEPKKAGEQWALNRVEPTEKFKGYVVGFGEDSEGELYVLVNGGNMVKGTSGVVYKIVPAS